jgi:hypothetical protein
MRILCGIISVEMELEKMAYFSQRDGNGRAENLIYFRGYGGS